MDTIKTEKRENLWLPFDALAAPTGFQASELWFEKTVSDIHYDSDFHKAFIYKVVNKKTCPVDTEWDSFAVAGSVISVLSDRLIIPRQDKFFYLDLTIEDLELNIWEALFYSSQENNGKLNEDLLGLILRLFLPREHRYEDNNGLYKISDFCRIWPAFCFCCTYGIAADGYIRFSVYHKGREIFEKMPQDFKNGIERIADRFPEMLKIVSEHIRRILLHRH